MFDLVLDLDCSNNQGLFFMFFVLLHLKLRLATVEATVNMAYLCGGYGSYGKRGFLLLIKNVKKLKVKTLKKIKYISI